MENNNIINEVIENNVVEDITEVVSKTGNNELTMKIVKGVGIAGGVIVAYEASKKLIKLVAPKVQHRFDRFRKNQLKKRGHIVISPDETIADVEEEYSIESNK